MEEIIRSNIGASDLLSWNDTYACTFQHCYHHQYQIDLECIRTIMVIPVSKDRLPQAIRTFEEKQQKSNISWLEDQVRTCKEPDASEEVLENAGTSSQQVWDMVHGHHWSVSIISHQQRICSPSTSVNQTRVLARLSRLADSVSSWSNFTELSMRTTITMHRSTIPLTYPKNMACYSVSPMVFTIPISEALASVV
jgi:hypothetical protein